MNLARTFLLTLIFATSGFIASAQTLQTLISFNGTNGANPNPALTLGSDGNFYGTTGTGGSNGAGTMFQITTNGTLTTLFSFPTFNIGWHPNALTLGNDGNFYGTTQNGGYTNLNHGFGYGTVFQITTNGTLTTLVSFNLTNGATPLAGLTVGNDGNFYGTTGQGGNPNLNNGFGCGTIFKITTNGTLTTLVSFAKTNGQTPEVSLTLGNDGNFYSSTLEGGNTNLNFGNGVGTIFKVTPSGNLTTLVSFNGTNGVSGLTILTLGNDGNFYGTTSEGGNTNLFFGYGDGTVFQMTTNGTLTTLISFNGTNGANPSPALTLGIDGNFYGTTGGTIFKDTTNGTLTTLIETNGWSGGTLTLGNDGNFYGATGQGGVTNSMYPNGSGTVFCLLIPPPNMPFIAKQPLSQKVGVGNNVTFTATAYGAPPLVFQWYYNNSPVGSPTSGSNLSSYTLMNVQTNQSGNYSVKVINGYDSATSSNAMLTVILQPTMALQFLAGYPLLNLNGMLSNNFVVQYSTNLASTNWINLLSVSNLSSSPYQFLDSAGIVPPARFYRALMQ